jgi:hypothetical protein
VAFVGEPGGGFAVAGRPPSVHRAQASVGVGVDRVPLEAAVAGGS